MALSLGPRPGSHEWGKYSVMTTTVGEILKWAVANKVPTVNLSVGNDVSKTRWGPTQVMFREATLSSPSFLGPLVRAHARLDLARRSPASPLARVLAFARRRR